MCWKTFSSHLRFAGSDDFFASGDSNSWSLKFFAAWNSLQAVGKAIPSYERFGNPKIPYIFGSRTVENKVMWSQIKKVEIRTSYIDVHHNASLTLPPVNWWLENVGRLPLLAFDVKFCGGVPSFFLLDPNLGFIIFSRETFCQGTFSGWIPNSSATAVAVVLWSPVHIQTSSPPKGGKLGWLVNSPQSFRFFWQPFSERCGFPRWWRF